MNLRFEIRRAVPIGAALLLFGCANEARVPGVIVDAQYGFPVKGANVRSIVGVVNSQLKVAEAVSDSAGRFQLRFESYQTLPPRLPLEISKEGYRSNVYYVRTTSPADTIALPRADVFQYQ